jgi:hypothetical protein
VTSCFISENANGVFLPFLTPNQNGLQSVLNNLYFQTCQFSYNYSNNVFVACGSSVFDTCDIAPIYVGSVALRLLDHGSVTIRNSQIEAWWTTRPRIVVTCTNMGDCTLTLDGATIGGSAVDPSFESYSLILSNSFCIIRNSGLYAGATDGLPILEYNGPYYIGSSGIVTDRPTKEKFFLNGTSCTRELNCANLQTLYGDITPTSPGLLLFQQHSHTCDKNGSDMGGWDDTWSLKVSARLAGPPFNDPSTRFYDLLAYAKDKQQLATFNDLSGRHIFGANDLAPSVAPGPGAGQSAAIKLDSRATDAAATVSLTCGSSPSAGSNLWTLTFGTPYTWPPHVVASPANANTAGVKFFVTMTETNCCLSLASGESLSAGMAYCWNVAVLGQ